MFESLEVVTIASYLKLQTCPRTLLAFIGKSIAAITDLHLD